MPRGGGKRAKSASLQGSPQLALFSGGQYAPMALRLSAPWTLLDAWGGVTDGRWHRVVDGWQRVEGGGVDTACGLQRVPWRVVRTPGVGTQGAAEFLAQACVVCAEVGR